MSLKKRLTLSAGAVLLVIAVVGLAVYRRAHAFAVEGSIHSTFYPVTEALSAFAENHGAPATNLTQLVPKYLAEIPVSRFADSVEYSVIDGGKAWQLSILSRALAEPRRYCCRSTQQFTDREAQRILLRYHAVWTVLREP